MTQVNPFTGSIVQAPQVQRTQAAEKDRHLRKVQDLAKNAALQGDQLQHEVESSEALTPVHDQPPKQQRRARSRPPRSPQVDSEDPGESHLDVTA